MTSWSIPKRGAASAFSLQRAQQGLWLMLAGGVLLGTLGAFLQEAGQSPLTAVWFRCAFGALSLLLYALASGRWVEFRLHGRAWIAAVAAGLLMCLNWALFFAAIERTSIAVATVVFHIQPLWLLAFGAYWLQAPVSPRQWAAAALALAGLALAAGALDALPWQAAPDARYALGLLMCLGGSLSYAGVTLIAQSTQCAPAARRISPLALAWWQCVVGTLALLAWPLHQGWPAPGVAWAWLIGLGVLHTGLAYVLLYAGMARLAAGRIALLQFVYPAVAVLVDWLVYGRALSASQLAGVGLMVVALAAAPAGPAPMRRSSIGSADQ